MNRHASNHYFGDFVNLQRPAHIRCPYACAFVQLATFAADQMQIACHELPDPPRGEADRDLHRHRLRRFMRRLGVEVVRLGLGRLADSLLAEVAPIHYGADGRFLSGGWSPDAEALEDLLWRLHLPAHVVSAAMHLHSVAVSADSSSERRAIRLEN